MIKGILGLYSLKVNVEEFSGMISTSFAPNLAFSRKNLQHWTSQTKTVERSWSLAHWPTSACMLRVPWLYRRGKTSQHSRRILSTTSYQITSFVLIKKSSFKITSTNPLAFFSFKNGAQMFFSDHNGAFLQIIAVAGVWWKSFVRTYQILQQLKYLQNEAYGIVIWICEFSYRMHPCISKDEGRGKSTLLWLVALQHIRIGRNTSFTW